MAEADSLSSGRWQTQYELSQIRKCERGYAIKIKIHCIPYTAPSPVRSLHVHTLEHFCYRHFSRGSRIRYCSLDVVVLLYPASPVSDSSTSWYTPQNQVVVADRLSLGTWDGGT